MYTENSYSAPLAKLFLYSESIQMERDIRIWNSKKYMRSPLLVAEDSSILRHRQTSCSVILKQGRVVAAAYVKAEAEHLLRHALDKGRAEALAFLDTDFTQYFVYYIRINYIFKFFLDGGIPSSTVPVVINSQNETCLTGEQEKHP